MIKHARIIIGLMLALLLIASQVNADVTYGIYALPDGWYQIRARSTVAYVGIPQNQIGSCQVTIKYPAGTANIVNLTSDNPLIVDWIQGTTVDMQTDDPGWTYISFGTTGGTLNFPANTEVNLFRFLNLTPCENIIGLIDHTTDNYYLKSITPGGNSVGNNPGNNFFQLINGEVYTGNHKPTATCYNQPPKALDDINSTLLNTPVNGQVLTNDSDPDGDPLVVTTTPVAAPTHGTVVLNSDGTYTYTPATGYIGQDQFTYQMCDQVGPHTDQYCQTADVIIQVLQNDLTRNDPPAANDDVYETLVNTTINGNVVINDLDPDKNPLTVNTVPVVAPAHGTVTLNASGTFTYTPVTGYIGDDSFTYSVCDNGSPALCDQAVAHISVYPDDNGTANDPPFAADDAFLTEVNQAINGSVAPNDSDPNGNPLTWNTTAVTAPSYGVLTLSANGSFVYTPMTGYIGPDHFVYQVCDNQSPALCDVATAYIVVEPSTNLPPIAIDDINNTIINVPVTGNVLTNDSDPNGNSLAVTTTPTVLPSNGSVVLQANGNYTYTPNLNFVGEDQFTYQVCDNGSPSLCSTAIVTIQVIKDDIYSNQAPIANPDAFQTLENKPISGSLISNDFDPDHDVITINTVPVTAPTHGTLTIHPDGTFTYTPNAGYLGPDQFHYEICDNGTPSLCDVALVTIDVLIDPPGNDAPIAADDAVYTTKNTPINGNMAANDSDPNGNGLVYTSTPVSGPTHGTVSITAAGLFTYTPASGYSGPDRFTYQVCDNQTPALCDVATVYITVMNHAPLAIDDINSTPMSTPVTGQVLTNDSDPNGDLLSVSTTPVLAPSHGSVVLNANGSYTYTPTAGYIGQDVFTYRVCDSDLSPLCSTASVTIQIVRDDPFVNDPPVANDDARETLVNKAVTGSLISNDDDPDGDPLVINTTPVNPPTHGTVVINADGTFTYTPNANYIGIDNFQYRVCDNRTPALCDVALVTIYVYPDDNGGANNPPLAADDAQITEQGMPVSGNLAVNDKDPNGDPLTYATTPVSGPAHGTVTIQSNGTFQYTPAAGYSGPDQFVYSVCDNGTPPLCDVATAYITVMPTNRLLLQIRMILQGPYQTTNGLMNDDLRVKSYLPTAQPYTPAIGFTHLPPGGSETINSSVLQTTGSNAIVDWVFIELRSKSNSATVLATRAALLQRDGDVVDLDGVSALTYLGMPGDEYYVAVRHRNHLGTMTASAISLGLTPTVVDFTLAATPVYGTNARKVMSDNRMALWQGNVCTTVVDRRVIYQGPNNDPNGILSTVMGDPGNTTFNRNFISYGYLLADVDLNGSAIYQGPNNDTNRVFTTVLTHPANINYLRNYIVNEQLP